MGTNWNKGVDAIAGGWQLGGIYTAHTGFPLTIKLATDASGTGARSDRPNVIGVPNNLHQIGPGAEFPWMVSAYAAPAINTFGNAGDDLLSRIWHGPPGSLLSARNGSTSPNTVVFRELRGEAFNLTNTPIFLSPASQTITSTLFGQIRSSEGERNVQVVAKFYF